MIHRAPSCDGVRRERRYRRNSEAHCLPVQSLFHPRRCLSLQVPCLRCRQHGLRLLRYHYLRRPYLQSRIRCLSRSTRFQQQSRPNRNRQSHCRGLDHYLLRRDRLNELQDPDYQGHTPVNLRRLNRSLLNLVQRSLIRLSRSHLNLAHRPSPARLDRRPSWPHEGRTRATRVRLDRSRPGRFRPRRDHQSQGHWDQDCLDQSRLDQHHSSQGRQNQDRSVRFHPIQGHPCRPSRFRHHCCRRYPSLQQSGPLLACCY